MENISPIKDIVFTEEKGSPIKDIVFTDTNAGSPIKDIVFTRRLYLKQGVIASLKKAIEIGHIENALFWGFELYTTGFEDEVINILCDHAVEIFGKKSTFVIFAEKKKKENKKNREPTALVTLIKNMISEYKKKRNNKIESKRFLAAKPEETETYMTNIHDIKDVPHYRKLRHLCTCQIESIYLTNDEQSELLDIFRNDWLKYAAKTPLWRTRIENLEGSIRQEDGVVIFPDDDLYESFLQTYGYEPDEQGVDIYEKCLGIKVQKIQ